MRYERCPLCNSPEIRLGQEYLTVTNSAGQPMKVKVERWKCENCRESFLKPHSRQLLDEAMGLPLSRR